MNVLALFAGYGGIELGLDLAGRVCGFTARTICYVEIEAFAAANLVEKMEAGLMDEAPVWSDIGTFDGKLWRNKVDCITAGFPCQPWSLSGKREGIQDERWLWSDIERMVHEVLPRFVFLENVPGLFHGGLEHVLGSLASLGFDAEWDVFSAEELEASQIRKRVFILGYSQSYKSNLFEQSENRRTEKCGRNSRANSRATGNKLAYTHKPRPQRRSESIGEGCNQIPAWPPGPSERDSWTEVLARWPSLEPAVRGVVDGRTSRMDELRALGNGVVPVVAGYAFITLAKRIGLLR